MPAEIVYKPKDAAPVIGTTDGMLAQMRHYGTGPKYIMVGGAVRYKLSHLLEYLNERTVDPEVGPPPGVVKRRGGPGRGRRGKMPPPAPEPKPKRARRTAWAPRATTRKQWESGGTRQSGSKVFRDVAFMLRLAELKRQAGADAQLISERVGHANQWWKNQKGRQTMNSDFESKRRRFFDKTCAVFIDHNSVPCLSQNALLEPHLCGRVTTNVADSRELLDAFAKSGPDWHSFLAIIEEGFEPDKYYRYRVVRSSAVGYARLDALTEQELRSISADLRRKGEQAMAEADALARSCRNLKVVGRN
jgi:hypothetical protein